MDRRRPRSLMVGLAVLIAVLAMGSASGEYYRHVIILTAISAILALGFDIVFGMAGQVALAQGAFFGIGAYATALLVMRAGWPIPIAVLGALVINCMLAALIALPALRVRGEYLLLLTLSFAIVVYQLLLNLVDVTNGPMGLSGVPSLGTLAVVGHDVDFSKKGPYLWLVIGVLAGALSISAWLRGSYLGRTLRAVRDDDEVAAASGIRVSAVLLFAFVASAIYASLAGSLYAHYIRVLDPSSFTILVSVEVLLMCVIGGRDSLWGPVIGALLVTGLPEVFRAFAEYRLVVYGLLIVVVMIFLPSGLSSLGRVLLGLNYKAWRNWRPGRLTSRRRVDHGPGLTR